MDQKKKDKLAEVLTFIVIGVMVCCGCALLMSVTLKIIFWMFGLF